MQHIFSFAITFFQTLSQVLICSAFLQSKKHFSKNAMMFIILILATFVEVNIFKEHTVWVRQIIYILLLTFFLHFAFRGSIASKALCSILSFVITTAIDYTTIFLMAFILNISYDELFAGVASFLIAASASCFVQFVTAFIFLRIMRVRQRVEHLSISSWVILAALPSFTMITLMIMVQASIGQQRVNYIFIVNTIGMLITNIALMLLITKVENEEQVKKANLFLHQQLKLQKQTANALLEAHTMQRKLTHDFKHHYAALNTLFEQGRADKASEYVKAILKTDKLNQMLVNTHNPFVDAVLNQKYAAAKANNILVEFLLNDLSQIPLNSEEIVVILSNLLDNAMEACTKQPDNRRIRVKIMHKNSELLISVGNSVSQDLSSNEGKIITTKPDPLQHGYGLQNICAIFQKYDCLPAIECLDGWFQFSAIIFK